MKHPRATSEPTPSQDDTLVERLAKPIDAWVDSQPANPLNIEAMNNWLSAQCVLAAAAIERLKREVKEQKAWTQAWFEQARKSIDDDRDAESSRDAAVKAAYEDAARKVPTNWLDPLLTGDGVKRPPLGEREVEALLRGIQDRIREASDRASRREG